MYANASDCLKVPLENRVLRFARLKSVDRLDLPLVELTLAFRSADPPYRPSIEGLDDVLPVRIEYIVACRTPWRRERVYKPFVFTLLNASGTREAA